MWLELSMGAGHPYVDLMVELAFRGDLIWVSGSSFRVTWVVLGLTWDKLGLPWAQLGAKLGLAWD